MINENIEMKQDLLPMYLCTSYMKINKHGLSIYLKAKKNVQNYQSNKGMGEGKSESKELTP